MLGFQISLWHLNVCLENIADLIDNLGSDHFISAIYSRQAKNSLMTSTETKLMSRLGGPLASGKCLLLRF